MDNVEESSNEPPPNPPKKKKRRDDDDDRPANEKTGRWTDDEHTRFLHGLELFGKKWTKVADIVGSRTTVQVRSHAQKYFQKLEKDRSGEKEVKKEIVTEKPTKPLPKKVEEKKSENKIPVALRNFLPRKVLQRGRASAGELAAGLFKFLTPLADPDDVPDWYRRAGPLAELLDITDWDDGGERLQDDDFDDDDEKKKKRPPKKLKRPSLKKTQSAPLPIDDLGQLDLPRYSSFDALCTVAVETGRKRALSQASDYNFDDDGLFYDDEGDDPLFLEQTHAVDNADDKSPGEIVS